MKQWVVFSILLVHVCEIEAQKMSYDDYDRILRNGPDTSIAFQPMFGWECYVDYRIVYSIEDSMTWLLNRNPCLKFYLEYHTDCRASTTFNRIYSQKVADSLKAVMVRNGADKSRIIAIGKGEDELFLKKCNCDLTDHMRNCSEEEHLLNHRWVIRVAGLAGHKYYFDFHEELQRSNGKAIRQSKLIPMLYDTDKYFIKKEIPVEFDSVAWLINLHPEFIFEVEMHTDCRASGDYNKDLSQRRADAFVDSVTSRGISSLFVKGVGKGESDLFLAKCSCDMADKKHACNEAAHQLNRRTVLRVKQHSHAPVNFYEFDRQLKNEIKLSDSINIPGYLFGPDNYFANRNEFVLMLEDSLVWIINDNPDYDFTVEMHTDCRASNEYSRRSDQRRADSTVALLVRKGADSARLHGVGKGESELLLKKCNCELTDPGSKCTEAEHQFNRRMELKAVRRKK